ncbi:MAG: CvpA family protein [Bacteroidales bacterium]|nr:CvpA family protein [Bacteroidales bacterium]MCF8336994.1 CvpA family protein [Bacteroidales bacterium]
MNILDIIIGIPVLWLAYRGFTKGFVIEVTTLIALLLGIYAAINFSSVTAAFLNDFFSLEENYMTILSFAVTFIAVVIAVVLIGRLLEKFINMIALGFLDKLAGGVFGILKAAFIISVIFLVINSFDPNENLISPKMKENSVFYEPVQSLVPTILPMVNLEDFEIPVDKEELEKKIT